MPSRVRARSQTRSTPIVPSGARACPSLIRPVSETTTPSRRAFVKAVGLAELEHHLPGLHPNDIVLFSSGNALNWGSDAYWHGWCYPDAAAARALINCGVSGVGFDGPSADPVESTDYELHQVWLGHGKIIIENMASMARLPARCRIVVAPLKVRGANGGPARIYALVDD